MKALVIGLGSMGRRRAKLLKDFAEIDTIIGIDLNDERKKLLRKELEIEIASTISEACEKYNPDIAFVSTSPLSHAQIIKECLQKDMHVFTELNLISDMYEDNVELAKKKGLILFLSSTFMYRKEIEYVKNAIRENNCIYTYMYHVGQYLPDWHPWENYHEYFVGDKRTNGCRELMAIELPWIEDTLGKIKQINTFSKKISSLSINFPDTYQLMIEHENGNSGLVTIDLVSRKAVRRLEISGEELYITWDGTPNSLILFDKDTKENKKISVYDEILRFKNYEEFIVENAYRSEIDDFIRIVEGKNKKARYSFEKDKEILKLIDEIEGAL